MHNINNMKKVIPTILFLLIIITIFSGCSSFVEKEKIKEQQALNNEINLVVESNNKRISSENFSYFIENSNGYDYIEIKDFETLFEENMPMIPYKEFEFDVPLDAEISVDAIFTNQTAIRDMNVPAFVSPPPMPEDNWDSGPVNVSDELGIFPETQFSYRRIKLGGNAIIKVIVYPLTYNASKDEIILNKNTLLKISYNSTNNGVVKNFNVKGNEFKSNSKIKTFTTIQNTENSPKEFKINIKIEDLSENAIETTEQTFELDGNEEKRIPIKIKTPLDAGAYSIVMNTSENGQEIGSAYEHINIIPNQSVVIDNFNISKKVLKNGDSYAFFNVEIENPTNESFRAYIDLHVQKGPVDINKRPQMFVDLEPKAIKEITDSLNIDNFEPGFYSVQAVVSVGEFWADSMESFEVTN